MPLHILIIEDNQDNMNLMVYLLQKFGFHCSVAVNGERGFQLASTELPDLIICDILLPKLSGQEIVKKLKSDKHLKAIPIIAVTALSMIGDKEQILSEGFDGYISKPIDPTVFVSQVKAYLK